ncbi:transposase [Streptosporangium canum]|uniref:transposase n=1 Tax=Streptosporangium canum TaxID=324952 RepID=UPI0034368683
MVLDRSSPALGERGPIRDLRQQFNAVMWRFRTGSPWRDLPGEYGPWVHRLRPVPVVGHGRRLRAADAGRDR